MQVLKKKYDNYKQHIGTYDFGESRTNQASAEEVDIYKCIEKYGASQLINKTMAQEFLYLDNTNRNLTLDEAIRQREQLTEYFLNVMPARARKVFGDSPEQFIEKYKAGEMDNFLKTGALSQEQILKIEEDETKRKSLERDKMKQELKAQIELEREVINGGKLEKDVNSN